MHKVVIQISQGSVVSHTMLGGLTTQCTSCKFPIECICAKNYENWLEVDKVIATISRLTFLAQPVSPTFLQQDSVRLCPMSTNHREIVITRNRKYVQVTE